MATKAVEKQAESYARQSEADAKRKAPAPARPERWQHRLGADGVPVININLGGRVRRFVSERGPDGQIAAMIEEPAADETA